MFGGELPRELVSFKIATIWLCHISCPVYEEEPEPAGSSRSTGISWSLVSGHKKELVRFPMAAWHYLNYYRAFRFVCRTCRMEDVLHILSLSLAKIRFPAFFHIMNRPRRKWAWGSHMSASAYVGGQQRFLSSCCAKERFSKNRTSHWELSLCVCKSRWNGSWWIELQITWSNDNYKTLAECRTFHDKAMR